MDIIFILLVGFVAGLIAGSLGVGGGILFVPVMIFFASMDMHHAKGTSLFAIIFVSASATISHWKFKSVKVNHGLVMGLGGLIGGVIGTVVSYYLHANVLEIIFGCFIIFLAFKIIIENDKKSDVKIEVKMLIFFIIGIIAGFVSGLIGVGGGVFMVPVLIVAGVPIHIAVGTSLMAIVVTSSASAVAHYAYGYIEIIPAISLTIGGCIGAIVGSYIGEKTPARKLRKFFSLVLLSLGGYMIYRGLIF